MVLRPDAIRERLAKLEEVTSRLESLGRLEPAALRANFRDAWAAEHGLHLGAEVIFDVGNHILSAHFGVSAQDYEDIVAQLSANAVIDPPMRDRLKGLGGFRNVLVHGYLRVDPARVAELLAKAPGDFSEFARAIRQWLATTLPGPS